MPGPLEIDLFTGEALDVDRLDAGSLQPEAFVGETLATKLAEASPTPEVDADGTDIGTTSSDRGQRPASTRERLTGYE
jgi:hypothetical protein